MDKRKFKYIVSTIENTRLLEQVSIKWISKTEVILDGKFKFFQNEQWLERNFVKQKFIVTQKLDNGVMLKGYGYGEVLFEEDEKEYRAIERYGEGQIFIDRKLIKM